MILPPQLFVALGRMRCTPRAAHSGLRLLFLVLACAPWLSADAKWAQQVVTLRPGWNSVWLEVTPEVNDIATVFAGLPVSAVWRQYAEQAPARYVDDASVQGLKPDPERWLTWMPGQTSGSVLKSLSYIHGGNAYLINSSAATNVTWTVTGRPVTKDISWLNASYTITGLPVDSAQAVTFSNFFAASPAHTGTSSDIRKLRADGTWATVAASTAISRGEAYWILSKDISSFQGPASVQVDDSGLLDFGRSTVEQTITLCNNTAADGDFTLAVTGATTPSGQLSAGPVQLSVWREIAAGVLPGWVSLSASQSVSVPAKAKKQVRLAIRRADMAGQGPDRPFASILTVTGLNTSTRIGLTADGHAAGGNGAGASSRFAGLWVGQCVVDKVQQAAATPADPEPTASDASLRFLVRVNSNGSAELLREAYVFWLDGQADGLGNITEPGRFLVAASDTEVAQFVATYGAVGSGRLKGAVVRDGANIPRRISSVGFSFVGAQPLVGAFDPSSGNLAATITVGYNDALNPYKHRYHPDHDNLVDGSAAKGTPTTLAEGRESYTITRQISLQFQSTDPEDLRSSGWGDSVAGGQYRETITGLHRYPVSATGTFRLTRAVSP